MLEVSGMNGFKLSTSKISSIAGVTLCPNKRKVYAKLVHLNIYHLILLHRCNQLASLVAYPWADDDVGVLELIVHLRVEGSRRPPAEELSHLRTQLITYIFDLQLVAYLPERVPGEEAEAEDQHGGLEDREPSHIGHHLGRTILNAVQ